MNLSGVGLGMSHLAMERESGSPRTTGARSAMHPVHAVFGRFELDERDARLLEGGVPVDLPPKPFAVLCALARCPGALLTKNDLLDEVWGHRFVTESVLKTAIAKVRKALHDDARDPRVIETVARRGYRFMPNAATSARSAALEAKVDDLTPERALQRIRELLDLLTATAHAGTAS